MNKIKKIAYLTFVGGLTLSALTACYWQANRYLQARTRWNIIRTQLNNQHPSSLSSFQDQDLFPFLYVSLKGNLKPGMHRIDRSRKGRMGYLSVRCMQYDSDK